MVENKTPATQRCGLVALIGRPNSGKSTLLNQLIGQKIAIVSDKPQTTRDRIQGVLNQNDAQLVFLDTPGIHRPGYLLNERMMETVYQSLREVDLVVHLVDITEPFGKGEKFVLETLNGLDQTCLLVLNKVDAINKGRILPIIEFYSGKNVYETIVPLSAKSGENLDPLLDEIISRLPEKDWLYPPDYLTDQTERFLATEIIREKVLLHTHGEIPYSTTVEMESFDESQRKEGFLLIAASIIVERVGQKKIVVGRAGKMIKQIGIAARKELLATMNTRRIHLDLHVKVVPGWRNTERYLSSLEIM